jgi:formate hydrogenlyase transcriptional activator
VRTSQSRRPREQKASDRRFERIVGNSPALEAALAQVERVAVTDSTVLVLGETGTGKELIAELRCNPFGPAGKRTVRT